MRVDPTEAPFGYTAIMKSSLDRNSGNLCRQCDWRPECQKPETDFLNPNHRCMSYAIVTVSGKVVQRRDGCSVAFKFAPFPDRLFGEQPEDAADE